MSKKGRRRNRQAAVAAPAAPPARKLSRRATIVATAVGLAALGVVAWAIRPAPPAPSPEQHAAGLLAKCTAPGAKPDACVQADLEQVLRTEGQQAAFAVLTLVSSSPALAGYDHALAHHMGRLSYTVIGDPAKGAASGAQNSMAGMAGMEGMDHGAPSQPRLHPDDLLYPCNQVEGKEAQIGCWQMQPFAVLMQTGNSFEKAFWACSKSGEFAVMCEEGIGQAAGSRSRIDRKPPESYCSVSTDRTAARHCMVGAVKDLIMNALDVAPGIKLCRGADADFAKDCYAAVGIMHAGIEGRPQARLFNCSGVPDAYRNACARVGPQKS
ncbi:MAG: hypothetical protein HYX65_01040 [Gemmatimonadetes bacterium]|nr:hypothetical protein [Gemmatimonadota bacterium]